jgi:hypothetical protein
MHNLVMLLVLTLYLAQTKRADLLVFLLDSIILEQL